MAGLRVGGPTFRYSDFPKRRPSTIFPRLLRCRNATSVRRCNCCVQKGKRDLPFFIQESVNIFTLYNGRKSSACFRSFPYEVYSFIVVIENVINKNEILC